MQKNIHPDYHEISVEMTDGTKFKTRSTYGKKGDTLKLDVDPTTHPAWTGGTTIINQNVSKVVKFKEKFGGINFSNYTNKEESKKEEKPENN